MDTKCLEPANLWRPEVDGSRCLGLDKEGRGEGLPYVEVEKAVQLLVGLVAQIL